MSYHTPLMVIMYYIVQIKVLDNIPTQVQR